MSTLATLIAIFAALGAVLAFRWARLVACLAVLGTAAYFVRCFMSFAGG